MLDNTCAVCGLPNELCVCQEVEKTASKIEVKVERRKYGKFWAVVSGIDTDAAGLKDLVKKIKNKMAVAGTVKGKNLEILFGRSDKTKLLIGILVEQGFNRDSISTNSFK